MANKEGLGVSRKYANGTVHENASGQFIIMDRYLENDDNVMLKFQWLTGDNEGQIDTNKEMNINSSIYKFKMSRGLPKHEYTTIEPFTNKFAKFDEAYDTVNDMKIIIENIDERLRNFGDGIVEFKQFIKGELLTREEIQRLFSKKMKGLEDVIYGQQTTINLLSDNVDKLLSQREVIMNQQEIMLKQSESVDKLISTIDNLSEQLHKINSEGVR